MIILCIFGVQIKNMDLESSNESNNIKFNNNDHIISSRSFAVDELIRSTVSHYRLLTLHSQPGKIIRSIVLTRETRRRNYLFVRQCLNRFEKSHFPISSNRYHRRSI